MANRAINFFKGMPDRGKTLGRTMASVGPALAFRHPVATSMMLGAAAGAATTPFTDGSLGRSAALGAAAGGLGFYGLAAAQRKYNWIGRGVAPLLGY